MAAKLQAVYAALDQGSNETALKLLKGALKKAARGTRAELLALRGVALDRLGRGTEALAACDEACQQQPLEALGAEKAVSLLYTLSLVYTAAGQHGKVTALTAGLAAAAPKDPDLQERLFKCHCREFDFVRMQQVAMRLYKLTGNSSYLMWAVTTMLLQATHGGEEKLLVLAETMAGRCWAQKRAAGLELGREAFHLQVEILSRLGKHQEALAFLEGFAFKAKDTFCLANVMSQAEHAQLLAMLRLAAGDRDGAIAKVIEVLEGRPGDIRALESLLDIASPGTAPPPSVHRDSYAAINALDRARELSLANPAAAGDGEGGLWAPLERTTASMQAAPSGSKADARGAALAPLTLVNRRLAAAAEGPEAAGLGRKLAEMVFAYWGAFGTLASCRADVKAFLRTLAAGRHEEAARWLCDRLMAEKEALKAWLAGVDPAALPGDGKPAAIKKLYSLVACFDLCEQLGIYGLGGVDIDPVEVLDIYFQGAALAAPPAFDRREYIPGSSLINVAASHLIRKGLGRERGAGTLAGMIVLEIGAGISPHDGKIRCALAAVYGALCVPGSIYDQIERMEVKNIQYETLACQFALPCYALFNPTLLGGLCSRTLRFHRGHFSNAGDTFALAFKHGTYIQALDFANFRERLACSFTKMSAQYEGGLGLFCAQIVTVGTSPAEAAKAAFGGFAPADDLRDTLPHLRFNHDLQLRPDWFPPASATNGAALVDWLDGRGPADVWWDVPKAAELDAGPARETRAGLSAYLANRVRLVRVLMLLTSEVPDLGELRAAMEDFRGNQAPEREGASAQIERCTVEAVGAAVELTLVAEQLGRGEEDPAAGAEGIGRLEDRLAGLRALVEDLAATCTAGLASAPSYGQAKALNAAGCFVKEGVLLMGICFQHNIPLVLKTKKLRKRRAGGEADPLWERFQAAVSAFTAAAVGALDGLRGALAAGEFDEREAAADFCLRLKEKNQDLYDRLFDGSWAERIAGPRVEPQALLSAVFGSQAEARGTLEKACRYTGKILSSVKV